MAVITKRKVIIAFVIMILGIGLIFYMAIFSRRNIPPIPLPKTGASYNNLTPGKSSESDVKNQLGTPIKEPLQAIKKPWSINRPATLISIMNLLWLQGN